MNKQELKQQYRDMAVAELAKGNNEYLFNCDWKRIFKAYYLDVQHKFSESYLGETTILEECKAVAALRDLCDRYIKAREKEKASGIKRWSGNAT